MWYIYVYLTFIGVWVIHNHSQHFECGLTDIGLSLHRRQVLIERNAVSSSTNTLEILWHLCWNLFRYCCHLGLWSARHRQAGCRTRCTAEQSIRYSLRIRNETKTTPRHWPHDNWKFYTHRWLVANYRIHLLKTKLKRYSSYRIVKFMARLGLKYLHLNQPCTLFGYYIYSVTMSFH